MPACFSVLSRKAQLPLASVLSKHAFPNTYLELLKDISGFCPFSPKRPSPPCSCLCVMCLTSFPAKMSWSFPSSPQQLLLFDSLPARFFFYVLIKLSLCFQNNILKITCIFLLVRVCLCTHIYVPRGVCMGQLIRNSSLLLPCGS